MNQSPKARRGRNVGFPAQEENCYAQAKVASVRLLAV